MRVGLVLCSGTKWPLPSTRVAVLNMLPFLRAAGFDPCVVFEPPVPSETPILEGVAERAIDAGCRVVVLQKVHGQSAVNLARQLTSSGISVIYVVCDVIEPEMAKATSATVAVTEYLRSLYPRDLQTRIHVVHDGIERSEASKTHWSNGRGSYLRPLRAVLVTSAELTRLPVIGSPPPWLKVRIVGRYARGLRRWREMRWTWAAQAYADRFAYLRFLLNPRIACATWDPDGVYGEMMRADIGVLPIDTADAPTASRLPPAWALKSENRLTMKMSMALPVIATPIPSYESIVEHGVNGFFARSRRDWAICLEALRDPERRRAMGSAARASVISKYSMEEQARRLLQVMNSLVPAPPQPSGATVTLASSEEPRWRP